MSFPCNGCGACCRRVGLSPLSVNFPFAIRADNSCSMLLPDNRCAVYDTRPLVCRVDAMIDLLELDRQDAYEKTIALCNQFKREDNLNDFILIP